MWILVWLWAATAYAGPVDDAMNALAADRVGEALVILRGAVRADPDPEIRCLLGRVALGSGRPEEALVVLDAVDARAPCAQRAAFAQAEALVALGRHDEAAGRYEALADVLLGPDRHAATAARLEQWSERLLADPRAEGSGPAAALLTRALALGVAPARRLTLARRLAALDDPAAVPALARAVTRSPDAHGDRRLLAPLLGGLPGLALLRGLPDDDPTRLARARAAADQGPSLQAWFATALSLEIPESRALRVRVGQGLAEAGWVDLAAVVLEPIATGGDEPAADALWALARARAMADASDAALVDLLTRFPLSPHRQAAEQLLLALRRDRARITGEGWAALRAERPDDPELALESAWALDGDARRAALAEVASRWPYEAAAERALRARVALDPEGMAWLEAQASAGRGQAAEVRDALRRPWLAVRSPGRQPADPVVEVGYRGLTQVEVRVHRIDLEGFVRAGRGPEDLTSLDVGLIPPDRTWTLRLADPGPGRMGTASVPVRVPGPGLYAVTVATPDQEARTFLLVSDAELVARAAGEDVVAAVFRGGRPDPGARLLVMSDGTATEVRSDASGVMRAVARGARRVLLAHTAGGPVLATLSASDAPDDRAVRVALDLDRPVYRPGDRVRFRVVATTRGEALRGRWRVSWAEAPQEVVRAETDAFGAIEGELVVPWRSSGRTREGAYATELTLLGLAPGQDDAIPLGRVRVVDEVPAALSLDAHPTDEGVAFVVVDGDGVPVPDHPVDVRVDGAVSRHHTDLRGQVALAAPPVGLPWSVQAEIPNTAQTTSWARDPEAAPLVLRRVGAWAPGAPGRVALEGPPGPVRILVARRDAPAPRAEAAPQPDTFAIPEFATSLLAAQPSGDAVWRTVATLERTLGTTPLDISLPPLDAGLYRIEGIATEGRAASATLEVALRDALRVIVGEPEVGEGLPVGVEGGPALVTVERGRILDAAIVAPGRTWAPRVDRRWHGGVQVVASRPEASDIQTRDVDARLDVALTVEPVDERWVIEATVVDGAGRPVQASVLLRAIDPVLVGEAGEPSTLDLDPFLLPRGGPSVSAVSRTLVGGAEGEPIAAVLRAEAMREVEAQRAALAVDGRLGESAASALFGDDVPLSGERLGHSGAGFGGGGGTLGGRGVVRGGGGVGRGSVGGRVASALRGARNSGLWHVARTDARGVVRLEMPAPPGRWRVEAVALGGGVVGRALAQVAAPDEAPRLVLDVVSPGWPGDEARPRARVVWPAGGQGIVRVDGVDHPVTVPPGGVATITLPSTPAGGGREVALVVGAQTVDRRTWTFPLAAGVPDPEGPIHVSASGLAALALAHDPGATTEPVRAIAAGRAAAVAAPHLRGAARDEALAVVRAAVGAATTFTGEVRGAAHAILLVADARWLLGLPQQVLDDVVARAADVEPRTPRERLELTWARAVATGRADEAALGRLVRDAALLSPRDRALLDRLLVRVGEKALGGAPLEPAEAPPPVGDLDRAAFVEAVAERLASARPSGTSREVRTRAPGTAGGLSWREAPPEAGEGSPQETLWPVRIPMALDGRPAEVQGGPACGSADDPCRLEVGEGIAFQRAVTATLVDAGGLRRSADGRVWVATAPGRFTLRGLRASDGTPAPTVFVEVGVSDLAQLGEAARVAVAQSEHARGRDPRPLLADRPSLEDWSPALRSAVARLRFEAAGQAPGERIAAFEDLRDEDPSASIPLDAVAETARAYRALGRPDRALTLWRRLLGQAFLTEAAVSFDVEAVVGPLAGIQVVRETVARFPEVPLVEEALFSLPDRLLDLAGDPPEGVLDKGVTPTDLRLMAAAWDREFVALHPGSAWTPEAGLRLATTLFGLGARDAAAGWVARLARAHPEHPLLDRWLLLQALADTDRGRAAEARRVLRRIAEEELPMGGGQRGPSPLRDDARFALGRLAEAADDPDGARAWYRQVAGSVPEAALSLAALEHTRLDLDPVVRLGTREAARVEVRAVNVGDVHVSAFAVDLRTLFLREAGLPGPGDLRVEGLSPVWAGRRAVGAGPFPEDRGVDLPLAGPGAWLIRLDGEGVSAATLLVRSGLELAISEADPGRVSVRFEGAPAAGVQVRAVSGGRIVATETDARGVARVPGGSAVLAQRGPHAAVSETSRGLAGAPERPPSHPETDVLLQRLNDREAERRRTSRARSDAIGKESSGGIDASEL